jgi:DNA-binding transcriptional regulator YhcF (GntR family)
MSKIVENTIQESSLQINGYKLSRWWWDFALKNPGRAKPVSSSLFLWICELYNRLDWPDSFGLPTLETMAIIGISNWRTYKKAFDVLVDLGFIIVVEKSINQYTATTISVKDAYVKNTIANGVAYVINTEAEHKQIHKQVRSTANVNKPLNRERKETVKPLPEVFTSDYKAVNKFDLVAFKIWKQFYENMIDKQIHPNSLEKSKIKVWTDAVRRMIESDGRTEEEIVEVLAYLREDDFWANNIKSATKLRGEFENLMLRARTVKRPQKLMSNAFKEAEQNYYLSNNQI